LRTPAWRHSADRQTDGEAMLAELLADWRTAHPDVPVRTRVAHGPAADVILAAGQDGDLLLISRRRHGLPPSGHPGGVAHAVLRRSDVPVAVVSFEGTPDELTPALVLEGSGKPLE
jgi:nucleotide-binding universal stress UspA family protein